MVRCSLLSAMYSSGAMLRVTPDEAARVAGVPAPEITVLELRLRGIVTIADLRFFLISFFHHH